jgi:hypothetical protein
MQKEGMVSDPFEDAKTVNGMESVLLKNLNTQALIGVS